MRYLMMAYNKEPDFEDLPRKADAVSLARDITFHNKMTRGGRLLAAERLYPSVTATTLRIRASEVVTSDGPFVETGDQISGIYIVESQDLDEALQIAAWISAAHSGAIEVRPIMEVPSDADVGDYEL